jgi:hypothetical protein
MPCPVSLRTNARRVGARRGTCSTGCGKCQNSHEFRYDIDGSIFSAAVRAASSQPSWR